MRKKIIFIIKQLFLILFTLAVVILPLWMLVINSFKPAAEVKTLNLGLPEKWSIIENYKTVVVEGNIIRGFFNSLLITVITVILVILFGSMASWVLARKKSKIMSLIYFISILGVLVPPAIITTIRVFHLLKIQGTYMAVILFYSGVFLPLVIFLTVGFIKTIPIELEEAARIDGASPINIFFKIIFPLLKPVRLTSMIFVSMFIWNDFIYPFYYISKSSQYTMVLGLYNFASKYRYQIRWELVFADVIMVSIPIIIVYIFAQKNIVSGIMGGATKG